MENLQDTLTTMYKNALSKTSFQPIQIRQLLTDSKVFSNVMDYARLLSNNSTVIYDVEGNPLTFESSSKSVITSYVDEAMYRKADYVEDVTGDFELQLAEEIDSLVYNYLKKHSVSADSVLPDLVDRIIAIKNKFNNKSFVLLVGLENYLSIIETYNGKFPYPVVYCPLITEDEIYAIKPKRLYINALIDEVNIKKNVMTGQYIFALNILNLEVGCDESYFA